MHAKVVVADDVSFVGSFNFSRSGERNAENVLEIHDTAIADRLATFIDEVRARYPRHDATNLESRVEDDRPAAETSCMRTAVVATLLAAVVATSAALGDPAAGRCQVPGVPRGQRLEPPGRHPSRAAAGSAATIAAIGPTKTMHADFGSGLWDGGPIGIPITIVAQGPARRAPSGSSTPTSPTAGPTRSRPASRSRAAPRPTVTGTHSSSTATRAASTSCSRSAAPAAAGRRDPARSGISARTGCVRPAGPPPTRPGCRSCPASRATTRSRRDESTTRCASRSRARNGRTSGRRGTTRAR